MARGTRTRQDFVDAALAIVTESGWSALTPAALAARLEVHPTAVYRHLANWNDLVVAAFDVTIGQVAREAMAALPPEATPRERIEGFMRAMRSAAESEPALVDCILGILRAQPTPAMPNFDAASAQLVALLAAMGVPESLLPQMYQAVEGLMIGSVLTDYLGHPQHLANRRQRRRMSGVAAFEESTRSDEATKALSDATFELSSRLLLDECERMARALGTDGWDRDAGA